MNPPGPPIEILFPGVTPLSGEIGRYHVASRSGPHPHLVDLFEYALNGACTCEHFKFRLEPSLVARGVPANNTCKCYHIQQAERHFAETMKRELWKQANPPPHRKPAPWPAAALILILVSLCGCGESPTERQRELIERYGDATAKMSYIKGFEAGIEFANDRRWGRYKNDAEAAAAFHFMITNFVDNRPARSIPWK